MLTTSLSTLLLLSPLLWHSKHLLLVDIIRYNVGGSTDPLFFYFLMLSNIIYSNGSINLTLQQRGWFDVLDDWLKRDRFVFVGWSGLLLFPTAYLQLVANLLAQLSLRFGIPTGWRLVTLRASIFLQRQCQLLLTLWVILSFTLGSWLQGGLYQVVPTWGTLGFCGAPLYFALIGFMLRQFELARLIGIRPYNAIAFSGPIAVFVSVFLIYPLGQSSWFLRRVSVSRRYSASFSSSRAFITGRSIPSI